MTPWDKAVMRRYNKQSRRNRGLYKNPGADPYVIAREREEKIKKKRTDSRDKYIARLRKQHFALDQLRSSGEGSGEGEASDKDNVQITKKDSHTTVQDSESTNQQLVDSTSTPGNSFKIISRSDPSQDKVIYVLSNDKTTQATTLNNLFDYVTLDELERFERHQLKKDWAAEDRQEEQREDWGAGEQDCKLPKGLPFGLDVGTPKENRYGLIPRELQ